MIGNRHPKSLLRSQAETAFGGSGRVGAQAAACGGSELRQASQGADHRCQAGPAEPRRALHQRVDDA